MKKIIEFIIILIVLVGLMNIINRKDSQATDEVVAPIPVSEAIYNIKDQTVSNYIVMVWGDCSNTAKAYLQANNPSYNTSLVQHNYIGNRYYSSQIGLFALNDSLDLTREYSIAQLEDYRVSTLLAYKLFLENGHMIGGFSCQNY